MINVKFEGDFDKLSKKLKYLNLGNIYHGLEYYGKEGVKILKKATPVDTGETANSWYYNIVRDRKNGVVRLEWRNSKLDNDSRVPVVILLQYGHMANGAFVEGNDFINPSIKPLFDKMANSVWEEVIHALHR